jgi:SNF2 family DNA or RNA helicase
MSYPLDVAIVRWFEQENIPDMVFTSGLQTWMATSEDIKATTAALARAKYTRVELPLPYASKLYDYQTVGVKWLVEKRRGILADEPGLGKTIQALAAADLAGVKHVIVFTVNQTVQEQWADTIQTWNLGSSIVVKGTKAERLTALGQTARWIICPTSILSSSDKRIQKKLLQQWDVIIFDEGHMLQSKDSARGAMAAKLKSVYMFLLSGTPVWNNLPSLWNLLHIVNQHRWKSYWAWIDKYFQCWMSPFGKQVGKPRNSTMDELRGEIAEVLLRRELVEVCADFPVAKQHVIELEMPEDMHAEYKRIQEAIRQYQDVTVCGRTYEITSGVQKISILRNFCNGGGDSTSTGSDGSDVKRTALLDTIQSIRSRGLQALVFTWHTDYADQLANQFGAGAKSTHGKKPQDERAEIITGFKSKQFDVLVASMASLGVGVDLPDVDVLIFAECDWTPAMIEQAWRRIYRISSKTAKLIIFIYYKKTVEEMIYKAFSHKQAISDELLADQALIPVEA